jgi:hypothetical protein
MGFGYKTEKQMKLNYCEIVKYIYDTSFISTLSPLRYVISFPLVFNEDI